MGKETTTVTVLEREQLQSKVKHETTRGAPVGANLPSPAMALLQCGAGNQAMGSLLGSVQPLPDGLRGQMEQRFGADFRPVASRAASPGVARAVDEWLAGSVDVAAMSPAKRANAVNELQEWLQRQTASNQDTAIIAEQLSRLRGEQARLASEKSLDVVGWDVRDNVALAIVENLVKRDLLARLAADPGGLRLLVRLYDELTTGNVWDGMGGWWRDEKQAVEKIVEAMNQAGDLARFSDAVDARHGAPVIPISNDGLVSGRGSWVHAALQPSGRIFVKPSTNVQDSALKTNYPVFFEYQGAEFDPMDVLLVLHVDEQPAVAKPVRAYELLSLSNAKDWDFFKSASMAAISGATAPFSATGAAGRGMVGRLAENSPRFAQFVQVADAAGLAWGVVSPLARAVAVDLVRQCGDEGRWLMTTVNVIDTLAAIYGIGRVIDETTLPDKLANMARSLLDRLRRPAAPAKVDPIVVETVERIEAAAGEMQALRQQMRAIQDVPPQPLPWTRIESDAAPVAAQPLPMRIESDAAPMASRPPLGELKPPPETPGAEVLASRQRTGYVEPPRAQLEAPGAGPRSEPATVNPSTDTAYLRGKPGSDPTPISDKSTRNKGLENFQAVDEAKIKTEPMQPGAFGKSTGERTGTEHRSGMEYHLYTLTEVAVGLRVERDMGSGMVLKVSVDFRAAAARYKGKQQTSRSFSLEESDPAAQSRNSAYMQYNKANPKAKMEKGHGGQREAGKSDPEVDANLGIDPTEAEEMRAEVERGMDKLNAVMPMRQSLNRGAGSEWAKAERETKRLALKHEWVRVEVVPSYDPNPPRLPDGTPIPSKFLRRVLDGFSGEELHLITVENQ